MRLSELEILLALCDAAPLLQDVETAERLLNQLSPYLLEAPTQAIASTPFLRFLEPSPWEALSNKLACAVLSIGSRYPLLRDATIRSTTGYLHHCLRVIDSASGNRRASEDSDESASIENSLHVATVSVSLLGFLEALSLYANFYHTSEIFELTKTLRQILDENLMVSVEGIFSAIRTSESHSSALQEWQTYTKRYAASGRPLGAMLLQRGFMRFLVSCSSLKITMVEHLRKADSLSYLMLEDGSGMQDDSIAGTALIELVSDIAAESMRLLEDGSDYLRLGSAWQQRLAFTVKAYTLHTFLNCMVVDENIADVELLMSWLEDTMADPIQMADEALSRVVLKSMAVVAKSSPSFASTLSRSLPKFIVQGGIRGGSVEMAARSLTFILQRLSQDAVITGLYSLGNVLSSRSGNDKGIGNSELLNGTLSSSKGIGNYTQHSTGSAISIDLSDEEETSAAYGNVVRAIVSIASSCQDGKITALAQSMLMQKLGRVSLAVDLHIVSEAAKLATAGGPTEFKSLLKLYVRLGHEAVVKGNSNLKESVRIKIYLYTYTLREILDTICKTINCKVLGARVAFVSHLLDTSSRIDYQQRGRP